MKRLLLLLSALVLGACGGRVGTPTDPNGEDAGPDSGPIDQCHGYCPQPNGTTCASDCDCYGKCLGNTDKPPTCADPLAPAISCGNTTDCPAGQTCAEGVCQGAPCGSNDDCPAMQQCLSGACAFFGCI